MGRNPANRWRRTPEVDSAVMAVAREAQRDPNSPRLEHLRGVVKAAKWDSDLDRLLADAPPLTPERRRRIELLLAPE
jgi:hypothetical protein